MNNASHARYSHFRASFLAGAAGLVVLLAAPGPLAASTPAKNSTPAPKVAVPKAGARVPGLPHVNLPAGMPKLPAFHNPFERKPSVPGAGSIHGPGNITRPTVPGRTSQPSTQRPGAPGSSPGRTGGNERPGTAGERNGGGADRAGERNGADRAGERNGANRAGERNGANRAGERNGADRAGERNSADRAGERSGAGSYRNIRPYGGGASNPGLMRANAYNAGWQQRAHYPERRKFDTPFHFGDSHRYREHFHYLEPQAFYQGNMGAFVAFVAVPIGALAVADVADAAPQDGCVDRAAAQDVRDGTFYADGPPMAGPPGAGGVVCNGAMINGVTSDQTADAAAQMAAASAQGQTSGTLQLKDDKGRPQQVPFTVVDSYTGVAEVDMPLLSGVEPPASGANIPRNPFRRVVSQGRLRVRSAPSEQQGKVTGQYDAGQIVQVQAITPDGNWALVAFGGFGVGYVSVRYLAVAPGGTTASAVARPMRPVAPAPVKVAAAKPKHKAATQSAQAQTAATTTTEPAKFDVYKVHALAPCQTFVVDQKMRNQACGFGGGTVAYNNDTPKLQSGG